MTPGGQPAEPEVWDATAPQVRRPRPARPPGAAAADPVSPGPPVLLPVGVPGPAEPPRAAGAGRLLRLRSDAVLAERFVAGDQAAFAALYERHRRSVLAVCVGVLGGRDDAEDAAQECFAALAQALRQDRPRDLRAWLVRVARNAAIDVRRRRRVQPAWDDAALAEDGASAVPGTGARPPASPHDATRVGAELESVLEGIRELPETQRTALLMRELAGHSYREIADVLSIDEQAVRGLIARARVGLREHRAASELPCAAARAALATEPSARIADRTVRRHVHGCASCRAYRKALRADAQALRALVPAPTGGLAGGGAVAGLAAKGAFAGGAAGLGQLGAACAASICTVGAVALLYPHDAHQRPLRARPAAHPAARVGHRSARDRHRLGADRTAIVIRSPAGAAAGAAASGASHLRLPDALRASSTLTGGRRTGSGGGTLGTIRTGATPRRTGTGDSTSSPGSGQQRQPSGGGSDPQRGWPSSSGRSDGSSGRGGGSGGDHHGGWGAGASGDGSRTWQPGDGFTGAGATGAGGAGGDQGAGQPGAGYGDGGPQASGVQSSGGQASGNDQPSGQSSSTGDGSGPSTGAGGSSQDGSSTGSSGAGTGGTGTSTSGSTVTGSSTSGAGGDRTPTGGSDGSGGSTTTASTDSTAVAGSDSPSSGTTPSSSGSAGSSTPGVTTTSGAPADG